MKAVPNVQYGFMSKPTNLSSTFPSQSFMGKGDVMDIYYGRKQPAPNLVKSTSVKHQSSTAGQWGKFSTNRSQQNSTFEEVKLQAQISNQSFQRQLNPPPRVSIMKSDFSSMISADQNNLSNQNFSLFEKTHVNSAPTSTAKLISDMNADGGKRAGTAGKRVRFSSDLVSYDKAPTNLASTDVVSVLKSGYSPVILNGAMEENRMGYVAAKKDKGIPTASPKKMVPARPSLSDQLSAIGAAADALTQDIRLKGGLSPASGILNVNGDSTPILTLPTKNVTIGNLNCRFPAPIQFFSDRCEYVFHHPYESSEIQMVMYYMDMSGTVVTGNKMRFRLSKKMAHFPLDFDPKNPLHTIGLEFATSAASASIRQRILPLLPQSSCPPVIGRR